MESQNKLDRHFRGPGGAGASVARGAYAGLLVGKLDKLFTGQNGPGSSAVGNTPELFVGG